MKRYNLIFSIILIVIVVLIYQWSINFPENTPGSGLGPGFFPRILIIMMLFISIYLIATSIIKKKKEKSVSVGFNVNKLKKPILIVCLTILYTITLNYLGFLLDTIIYLIITSILFGNKYLQSLLFSIIFTFLVYLIFKKMLRVPLPPGILGIAW